MTMQSLVTDQRDDTKIVKAEISVRMGSGTFTARARGWGITASCTESMDAAAKACAKKLAERNSATVTKLEKFGSARWWMVELDKVS
jgi:hypothetical protein